MVGSFNKCQLSWWHLSLNIFSYQEYLSCYWPNFQQTFWIRFFWAFFYQKFLFWHTNFLWLKFFLTIMTLFCVQSDLEKLSELPDSVNVLTNFAGMWCSINTRYWHRYQIPKSEEKFVGIGIGMNFRYRYWYRHEMEILYRYLYDL